ncbi:MAG: YceI family protein [Bacteroidota bacterium]
MKKSIFLSIVVAIASIKALKAQKKSYLWDAIDSSINFEVDYLGISETTGRFSSSEGSLTYSKADFSDAEIIISAQASRINTGNDQRDGHLGSQDFLDVDNYTNTTFKSKKLSSLGKNKCKVTGMLTMKEVPKSIETETKYLGEKKDAYGQKYSLWKVDFAVDRRDYVVCFNKTNEVGDYVIEDEVRMSINAKFIKY